MMSKITLKLVFHPITLCFPSDFIYFFLLSNQKKNLILFGEYFLFHLKVRYYGIWPTQEFSVFFHEEVLCYYGVQGSLL